MPQETPAKKPVQGSGHITVSVELGERSYPIYIAPGLLAAPEQIVRRTPDTGQTDTNAGTNTNTPIVGHKTLIVTDDTVAPLYLKTAEAFLQTHNTEVHTLILPDGEQHKNLETTNKVYDYLLQHQFDRKTTLAALGGGVIGDITGFAAATWQRGINYIQIPTTLLAQVDSSVGGKTGVNHPHGKNMIGAFHQPRAVFIDTRVLQTLPPRQLKAGMAEVIKYGLLGDAQFFNWLADNSAALLSLDDSAIGEAIKRCCEAKAAVVAADEKEAGNRALLNLGHSFAHAIETATGYDQWLHGEAVAMGMIMAADLSLRQNLLSKTEAHRIREVVEQNFQLAFTPPAISEEKYLKLMMSDKKTQAGKMRLILLRAIGKAFITTDVNMTALSATLNPANPLCE
ncbi:MAG: 3-dehydroquinate synthase [Pseudohongiellaceae bacterium]